MPLRDGVNYVRPVTTFTICAILILSLGAAIIGIIVVSAYKSALLKDDPTNLESVDFMWRILIGLGCVPGVIALYFRLTIPETPRFTMDIERNVHQASTDIDNVLSRGNSERDPDAVVQRANAPKASWKDFSEYFSKWENLKVLIGTSWSWFALDVCFASQLSLGSSLIVCSPV